MKGANRGVVAFLTLYRTKWGVFVTSVYRNVDGMIFTPIGRILGGLRLELVLDLQP